MSTKAITRTAGIPIGFRQGWTPWLKDLSICGAWAAQNGFSHIDIATADAESVDQLKSNGLAIGTADLLHFTKLLSKDTGERKDLIAQNVAYLKEAAGLGVTIFFTCILPGDPAAERSANYKLAVEVYAPLAEAADKAGARIAIEGYPGGCPSYAGLCTTPETCRAILKDIPSKSIGWNYDPSHLIRLGVDHVRFLNEFVDRVWHVHGKDTELMPEALYEYGLFQPAALTGAHGFGQHVWRYTIPGHGTARWTEIFTILKANGYTGKISVELEDEHFNGSEEGEKAGFLHSLTFLRGA